MSEVKLTNVNGSRQSVDECSPTCQTLRIVSVQQYNSGGFPSGCCPAVTAHWPLGGAA